MISMEVLFRVASKKNSGSTQDARAAAVMPGHPGQRPGVFLKKAFGIQKDVALSARTI